MSIRATRRGSIILIALLIALIMMSWAVAATYRTNFQTGAVLFSYRRSEAYYLAKRGVNRSLYFLNKKNSWGTVHHSRATGDPLTEGALSWLDASAATPVLRCEATVGGQTQTLSIPLLRQGESDTRMFMISPSLNGPDVISYATETGPGEALPNIPNCQRVDSVAGTLNGDVFAIAGTGSTRNLWRYRLGQGWQQMPDIPGNINISGLTVCGDAQLVCKGSDNTIRILPLGTSSSAPPMDWISIAAPPTTTLTEVAANPSVPSLTYATLTKPNGEVGVYRHNATNNNWSAFPDPAPPTGLNFSGGLTVDKDGKVFVAYNPPAGSSLIFKNEPTTPGDTSAIWSLLDPVPMFSYAPSGPTTIMAVGTYAGNVSNLKADNLGHVWSQYTNPTTGKVMTVSINDVPTPGVVNPGAP